MQPVLSIALVTRNRPDSLKRTLESLKNQEVYPFEIVISDDSDNLVLKQRNILLAKQYGCIYVEGPQKGLYANRNFVAKNCCGTHIRTMDDDHEFPKNHIRECIKAIELEPETIWTIGEYYPKDKDKPIPSPVAGQLHPRGFAYVPKNMNDYYGISCGGTIYPKNVIERNILNCEYYKFGMMFLEYGARLKKIGYVIKPLRSTYLIHHAEQTAATELPKQIINEARLFSMLCLSFWHFPTFGNKVKTSCQILYELIVRRYPFSILRNAYKIFKKYRYEMVSL